MIRLYSREGIERSGTRRSFRRCRGCGTVDDREDFVYFLGGYASRCHECQKPLFSRVNTPIYDTSKYVIISSYPEPYHPTALDTQDYLIGGGPT